MLNAKELYDLLIGAYGNPRWWSDDPFTVMFQAVLVQNTAWNNVVKTCATIGERLTPTYVTSLSTAELEQIIHPCGFYKAKARTIHALTAWFQQYQYARENVQKTPLPQLREELLSIRGIGEETADVILIYAFYKASFIIDAYTRRFLLRFGYDFSDDHELKQFFERDLPEDAQLYGWYHWLILEHCISICKKTPKCDLCFLRKDCQQKLSK
ncbi:endonuclease III domain-containing protein [Candidatus Methanomassiliicoccus intestinalis]|uniref:endonuclease III domain-containing protein n=1 Tax=Candidatus Methanomassiliicoccus intestinalis TaxID=1406512 RepID=UPI0037DCA3FF